MGAWADLDLNTSVMRGISRNDFAKLVSLTDADAVLDSAKTTARVMLTSQLAKWVNQSASADAFFDALAENTTIDRELAHVIGYAYAYHFYWDKMINIDDQWAIRARDMKRMLEDAVKSLAAVAPTSLSLVSGTLSTARSVAVNTSPRWWPKGTP